MSELEPKFGVVAVVSPPEQLTLPDLGQLSKAEITKLAIQKVTEVAEKGGDVLRLICQSTKMAHFAGEIAKAAKGNGLDELSKYGKEKFMREGVELQMSVSRQYDYSGDPIWQQKKAAAELAAKELKEWQEILCRLPYDGQFVMNPETGEEYLAKRPPLKKDEDIIKATIK